MGGARKGEQPKDSTAAQEAVPKREGPLGSELADETKVRPKAR